MTTIQRSPETVADLLRDLGDVSASRVRLRPPPGTATEADLVKANDEGILCELVDGTLLEKTVGFREALLAAALVEWLGAFVRSKNLGVVTGPDGMMKLFPGLIRLPDVAYVSWSTLPDGRIPEEAAPALAPDLAIEVLSEGNSLREMARKRREYFKAGTRLVWEVDPKRRTVAVYVEPVAPATSLGEGDSLDGGEVLPGFSLPLRQLFAELDRRGPG